MSTQSPAAAATAAARIKLTVTYVDLAAATLLAYDYMLTFGSEVRLVWPSRWSFGKILFFLTRYPPFVDIPLVLVHQFTILTAAQCRTIYWIIGWMLGTGIGIAEIILTMRTIVIWRHNKYVMYLLPLLLISFWGPFFYFLYESLVALVFSPPPRPDLPGCFLFNEKNVLYLCFVLIMGFESVVVALTLYKAIGQFRKVNSALMVILFRDGILNFIYLFVLSITNVVVLLTAPRPYTTLLTAFQRVMHSILTSRILLNLREAKSQDHDEVVMLKPGQIFPSAIPDIPPESRSPGYGSGVAFASRMDSINTGPSSPFGTPKSPRRFSFPSQPRSPAAAFTSPSYFQHPEEPPLKPTTPITTPTRLVPPIDRGGRRDGYLHPHWTEVEEDSEAETLENPPQEMLAEQRV